MVLKNRRRFVNHKKKVMLLSIFFLLLFITVGYAYLSAALSINGSTTIASNTWDIHFANLSVTDGSVTAITPAEIQSGNTSINYSVELSLPGDYYEFSVDVVNGGTLPAKVSLVNIQGISNSALPYLETSIMYDLGTNVQVDDLLNPNSSKKIIVRVAYIEDLNSLPEDDIELDLTFIISYVQTSEMETNASNLLQNLAVTNSCVTKYNSSAHEQIGVWSLPENVYLDRCEDKRNVIFGGFCWQVIRTTEAGGLKLLYNGEPVEGKCESTRENHKGIVGNSRVFSTGNSEYLYGKLFTYDVSSNQFTLMDTTLSEWTSSTYMNLIGQYTCRNKTGKCSNIYYVGPSSTSTTTDLFLYKIADTNYAQIGESPFNTRDNSPAMVGYMFNKVYDRHTKYTSSTTYKFGKRFTYNNGTYTLFGKTKTIGDWEEIYEEFDLLHYTCWNLTGECSELSYIYYVDLDEDADAYYINLTDGKSLEDAWEEMINDNGVNKYNSSVKGLIDSWYAQNLLNKTRMIDDAIYCNNRYIDWESPLYIHGWDPNGGQVAEPAIFEDRIGTLLTCNQITDQFSINNDLAKLVYPVALISGNEIGGQSSTFRKTDAPWWTSTPAFFSTEASVYVILPNGSVGTFSVDMSYGQVAGVRPAITLKPSVVISSGTGSEADPWIVE